MTTFLNITDLDGDVHLINVGQLRCCDIEQRSRDTFQCTLNFCDNTSVFYLNKLHTDRLIEALNT